LKVDFLAARDKEFFESSKLVTKGHGAEVAKKLKSRLDDLDAVQSMEDLRHLPGHWEELKKERAGQFSARLHGGLRLIVRPQIQPAPTKPDGGLDWRAIDSVFIVELVDYHA
jgi:toxin HigB-1